MGVLPVLQGITDPLDIFVMNFGLWHHAHSRASYTRNLHQLGRFYRETKAAYPYQLFMETPKQHFASPDGDYSRQWQQSLPHKGNFTCKPISGVTMNDKGELFAEGNNVISEQVAAGGWRNTDARNVLRDEYGMPLVPVYNATVPAWDMHRRNAAGPECSHFCHPSLPQLWVYTLYRSLEELGVRQFTVEEAAQRKADRSCVSIPDYYEAKAKAASLVKPPAT